jgi:hypothetical protein
MADWPSYTRQHPFGDKDRKIAQHIEWACRALGEQPPQRVQPLPTPGSRRPTHLDKLLLPSRTRTLRPKYAVTVSAGRTTERTSATTVRSVGVKVLCTHPSSDTTLGSGNARA